MRLSHLQQLVYGTLAVVCLGFGVMVLALHQVTGTATDPAPVNVTDVEKPVPAADAWPQSRLWAAPNEAEDSALVARYQLAGTFQVYRKEEGEAESAALVDDRDNGVQRIVQRGDLLGVFLVGAITEDELTLEKGGRSWVLTMTGAQLARPARETEVASSKPNVRDLPALETTPYGKRVKENYWIIERDALKNYIDEMMDPQNALRTINLYRSFSQVSNNEDEEPGYKIGMKGEESFFQHMGLQDGDIIRRVNSMKMRTQKRAEHLVREFYKDNMSAVVMDVERNGELQQHIYLMR